MTPHPGPQAGGVGVQTAGGRLCRTQHKHLRMLMDMRLGLRFCRHSGKLSPRPTSPALSLTPYLLGLGRGLGREAGAGTFRDPAVSVMRAHQLGRQDRTRGRQHIETPPCAGCAPTCTCTPPLGTHLLRSDDVCATSSYIWASWSQVKMT